MLRADFNKKFGFPQHERAPHKGLKSQQFEILETQIFQSAFSLLLAKGTLSCHIIQYLGFRTILK